MPRNISTLDALYMARRHEATWQLEGEDITITGLDDLISYSQRMQEHSKLFGTISDKLTELKNTGKVKPVFIENLYEALEVITRINRENGHDYLKDGNPKKTKLFWNSILSDCVYIDEPSLSRESGIKLVYYQLKNFAALAAASSVVQLLTESLNSDSYNTVRQSSAGTYLFLGLGTVFIVGLTISMKKYVLPLTNLILYTSNVIDEAKRSPEKMSLLQNFIDKHYVRKARNYNAL